METKAEKKKRKVKPCKPVKSQSKPGLLGSKLPKKVFTKRVCLRCQKEFPSWGVANRKCPRCLAYGKAHGQGMNDTYSIGD